MDEDPLRYLLRKPVQSYTKGQSIYDAYRPASHLYAVIGGRVKVTTTGDDGGQTVARFFKAQDLFGESCLVGADSHPEAAMALDNVLLMGWTRDEVEQQVENEPRLGLLLSQYFVRNCLELQSRIETIALCRASERVLVGLAQLATDLGTPLPNGAMRVASLTHHTIAEYVGTSREIITIHMNQLRRRGMLQYTRKHIDVHVGAVMEHLRQLDD